MPCLALAFAASFCAFLASFYSSFFEGPFFSLLIAAVLIGCMMRCCYCLIGLSIVHDRRRHGALQNGGENLDGKESKTTDRLKNSNKRSANKS